MLSACAAVTLLHYLRKGHLFVYAGTLIAIGGFAVLVEFLINITFHVSDTLVWSLYPLSCSLIFGVTLIVIACCPKMREGLRRKFFI